jgi:hypothetical protein
MTMAQEVRVPPDDLENKVFTSTTGEGAAAEGGSPGEPVADTPEPGLTNAQVFAGAIAAGREVFCLVTKLQSPKIVLTDDRTTQIGALWGPVLDKHGIQLGDYLGDYALEIAAVIGTIGIAAELRTAVSAELASRKPDTTEQAAPVVVE